MKTKSFSVSLKSLMLISATLLIFDGPTAAQPAPPQPGMHETVTVVAPYIVRRATVTPATGTPATGGGMARQIEVVSVDRAVDFSDLDLSSSSGAATLEKRIKDAAAEACREIDKRYPKNVYIPVSPNQDCAGIAAGNAMKIADELIAAAHVR
ncbi:MAG: UrcA family protein [Rhizomicrobium sp.]